MKIVDISPIYRNTIHFLEIAGKKNNYF
jgi:hypothetical protein